MHGLLLVGLYLLVMVTPVGLALTAGLPARPWRDELASSLGMAALAILLVEFVLSGRFRIISRRIGSDVTMRWHQLLARAALVFVLVHPFVYALPFDRTRPWDPGRSETLLMDPGYLIAGTLAYVVLLPFVLMAIWRDQLPLRYEAWRLTHGAGAGLIAAASAYHALAGGRYSVDPALAGFWLVLLALAALSLAVVYILKPLIQLRHPYQVTAVAWVAERTWQMDLKPEKGRALPFKAGQFAWLNIGHSPFSLEENPFSIASAPSDADRISFLIKEAGDFSRSLSSVREGTRAYLDGPHGHLVIDGRDAPGVALIAGGVGLAPLMSIVREMDRRSDPRPRVLVYGNRTAEQIAYREELAALAASGPLQVEHVLSEPDAGWEGRRGMIGPSELGEIFDGAPPRNWVYVLCGPPPMLESAKCALRGFGIPAAQILSERFVYD